VSDHDDRDLSAAFEELHAPRSTANYADRVPTVEAVETVYARRWPQALASVLAVLVALAGAGTFLALRNARQSGVGSSAGYPAARTAAAMAFDSTSGLTVMFGGSTASGPTLADTWTWDGSSWAVSTGPSPGKLFGAQMSDDPPDRGVLLIGMPQPANQGNGIACAVGGSGGAVTGTTTGTVAPGTPVASPPVPPAIATTPCPTPVAQPSLQTWLFTAKGWTHVAGATSATLSADTPYSGSQLAYDSNSGEVIAVSTAVMPACGPPLRKGGTIQPDHICPLPASGGQNSSTGTTPCGITSCAGPPCRTDIAYGCGFSGSMVTWTWAQGQWTQRRGALIPSASAGVVFGDAASPHATLVTETPGLTVCSQAQTCPAAVSATAVFTWAGSAWSQLPNGGGAPTGFSLAGATVASVNGHAIALTPSGQLYSWSTNDARWLLQTAASQPDGRTGASMAEGPAGSIVLFGGVSIAGKEGSAVIATGQTPGADTWTWNSSIWRHVAGSPPRPAPSPSPCSDVTGLGSNACARPPAMPPVSAPSSAAPRQSNPIGA
jgi:hypothetical protein